MTHQREWVLAQSTKSVLLCSRLVLQRSSKKRTEWPERGVALNKKMVPMYISLRSPAHNKYSAYVLVASKLQASNLILSSNNFQSKWANPIEVSHLNFVVLRALLREMTREFFMLVFAVFDWQASVLIK
jgi:hypothetical protein